MKNDEILQAVTEKIIEIIDRVGFLRRKKNNMSQVELAGLMGMKPQQLNKLLRYPSANMSMETIIRLEKALGGDILVTPNGYEAFLMNDPERLSKIIMSVFENDIDKSAKDKLLNQIDTIASHRLELSQTGVIPHSEKYTEQSTLSETEAVSEIRNNENRPIKTELILRDKVYA